jgi:hypothetical protein
MSQTPCAFINTSVRNQSHTSPFQRYKIYHRSPNSHFKQFCFLQSLLQLETSQNHTPNHFLFKTLTLSHPSIKYITSEKYLFLGGINHSRCPPSLHYLLRTDVGYADTSTDPNQTPHIGTETERKIALCVCMCVCACVFVCVRVGRNHSNYIHSQKSKVANTVEANALTLRVLITGSCRYRQSCLE